MDIKDIDTKKIYAYASRLEDEKKRFDADVEKAWTFHAEGYMSDEQYAALCADREAKAEPWKKRADLLRQFARAADAQNAAEASCGIIADFMIANAKPVESFDMDAIKAVIDCAATLDDPFPC